MHKDDTAAGNDAARARETSSAQGGRDASSAANASRGDQDNASSPNETDTDPANQDAFPWWALIVGLVVLVGGGSIVAFAFWKKRQK